MIVASHETEDITLHKLNPDGPVSVILSRRYLSTERETLENGHMLHITRCSFFENYLGVHSWPNGSRAQCMYAIEKFLLRIAKDKKIIPYLESKGFLLTPFAKKGLIFEDGFVLGIE